MYFYYLNDEVIFSLNILNLKEIEANILGVEEKHIPNILLNGNDLLVSVNHIMEENHYIMWIGVLTNNGFYLKKFNYNELPILKMNLAPNEKIIKVYEFCNIHKLWHN